MPFNLSPFDAFALFFLALLAVSAVSLNRR